MKPKKEGEKDYDKNYENWRHDVQTLWNAHKKALEALDGVISAEVSHTEGTAIITLEKDISDDVLKQAVEEQGYQVTGILN